MNYLLHQAIDQAAEQSPHHVAVRCAGRSLTYAELAEQTNQLAWTLNNLGVGRGDRVGIYMYKSLESVVSVYGILKAGAAYVPLDPLAPIERTRFVIHNCGLSILISSEAKIQSLQQLLNGSSLPQSIIGVAPRPDLSAQCIAWSDVAAMPADSAPNTRTTEQDLAYILYTSGSTGDPKGIMHTHRSGLSFAAWAATTYGLRQNDCVSNHAPLHFDLSTFDLFATALAGGTVVVIPEGITKFPPNVAQLIEQERISVWYSVPFALIQLLQRGNLPARDLSRLRWILFAGEPFPTKHLRDLMAQLPNTRFSNLYGPTETNVCTYYHVPSLAPNSDEPIPIGVPCANVDALVVDAEGEPVPAGESGELLIRGPIVMRGYWARKDLTERGFSRHSLLPGYEETYYRTGDLVRMRADGNYDYLGRKDRQIKTRGYRVELDEVEVALLAHELVQEAAVYTVPDGQGSQVIKAAVTAAAGAELTSAELIEHLAARLPPYAVPVELHVIHEFPRTSTGKIDRRSLHTLAVGATV